MRTDAQMFQLINDVAEKLGVVKAVALNGSKVYANKENDPLQDFDIIYVVPDNQMENLIDHHTWLDEFGEILVMQTPMDLTPKPIDYTKRFNFLMLFKDERRVDLGLVPESQVALWAKRDPISKILFDPENILSQYDLQTTDAKYFRKMPNQGAFMRHSNEFWWTIPYVVKGILRNQFFYAADHYYENVMGEFLIIIEWTTAGKHDFKVNLGKNLSNLLTLGEHEQAEKIQKFTDFDSYEKMAHNLVEMMDMFNELATKFAADHDLVYNSVEAQNVTEYTKEKLQDYLNQSMFRVKIRLVNMKK